MKKCPNCGQDNNDFSQVCEVCHTPLPNIPSYTENSYGNSGNNNSSNNYINNNMNNNQNQNQNNYNPSGSYNPNGGYNTNNYNQGNYPPQNNAGTYALVFGILSIVCCAIIFGPLAIIKGNEAKDSNGNIGKILGIVGLVLWLLAIIFNIIVGGFAFSNISSYGY
jgi:hypothetical protein